MSLSKLNFTEVSHKLNKANLNRLQNFKILILRDSTIEPIDKYLRFLGLEINYNFIIDYGLFDNFFDNYNINNEKYDLVILFYDFEKELQYSENHSQKKTFLSIEKFISLVNSNLNKSIQNNMLWISSNFYFSSQMYGDLNFPKKFENSFFTKLKKIIEVNNKNYFLNFSEINYYYGNKNIFDRRLWFLNKTRYTLLGFKQISKEIFKFIKRFLGKIHKCIIVDCDNTLWGGLIGEEGIDKIILNDEYPGYLYKQFQKNLLKLWEKGIIICLCSKNEEENVIRVLDFHKHMILKKKHISFLKVNWKEKHENILEISKSLNISTDNIIFIDDSVYEIDIVKKMIVNIDTLMFDEEFLLNSKTKLLEKLILLKSNSTNEDLIRNKSYNDEILRVSSKKKYLNVDDYYKDLKMRINILHNAKIDLMRAEQLCIRTNQFNFTSKRYTKNELVCLSKSNNYEIFMFDLVDKFGELGKVSMIILKKNNNREIEIDSFLMSCRVFGRKLEFYVLNYCINYFKKLGYKYLYGNYIPSSKNKIVKDFYKNFGFSKYLRNNLLVKEKLDLQNFKTTPINFFQS